MKKGKPAAAPYPQPTQAQMESAAWKKVYRTSLGFATNSKEDWEELNNRKKR